MSLIEDGKKRENDKDSQAKGSRLIEDEKHGFWTKPRPWVFVLLVAMEGLNIVKGPSLWYDLAVKYKAAGWTEASRMCCRLATFANPWDPDGKKAEIYSRVRLPKYDTAKEDQFKNIDGYNLDATGRSEEAIKVFEELIKTRPNFEWPYNNLANIRLERGEVDVAIELCQKALAINPDYANAYITMGNAYLQQGKRDEAKASMAKAAELLKGCGYE